MILIFIMFAIIGLSAGSIFYFCKKDEVNWYERFELDLLSIGILIASLVLIIAFFSMIIIEQSSYHTKAIELEYTERYNTIMMAAERENNLILLTSEISEYNSEILKARNNLDNPWINWFTNDIYNKLPLINLKELED